MTYYICIDDTDTLESRGTGEIAEALAQELQALGYGIASPVSRHQLYFHPDIPFTSHNSAMCFELAEAAVDYFTLNQHCSAFVRENSALGSDPGLCILSDVQGNDYQPLIAFGYRAKKEILTKDDAYDLAEHLGVLLSEHGGTGLGVIGALAGVGLRLDGNDGRYKGQIFLGENCDNMTVGDIMTHPHIDSVQDLEGYRLAMDEVVYVSKRIKTVRLKGLSVMLVKKERVDGHDYWKCVNKEHLKAY